MIITNQFLLPTPLVDAAHSEHVYRPHRYSVTELLSHDTTETVLTRRHDESIIVDVADMIWAVFGSAVHMILERGEADDGQRQEQHVETDVGGGITISGIYDLYDDVLGAVTDWKTATVWKVINGETSDWREQVTAYAWMLNRNGVPARRGQVVALLKDHSMRKAETERGYPPHPVWVDDWDIPLDARLRAGASITNRAITVDTAMEETPDADLPPCSPEMRWAKPERWAVMKPGRKSAVRLCDTEEEATSYAVGVHGASIECRPGEDTRCLRYCRVRQWCPYCQSNISQRG